MKRLLVKLRPDKKYLVVSGKNFYSKEVNKKHPLARVLFEKLSQETIVP